MRSIFPKRHAEKGENAHRERRNTQRDRTALEKVTRLEALLAEQARQTQPVPANITKSGMTLFSDSAPSQKTPTEFTDPARSECKCLKKALH